MNTLYHALMEACADSIHRGQGCLACGRQWEPHQDGGGAVLVHTPDCSLVAYIDVEEARAAADDRAEGAAVERLLGAFT